MPNTNINAGEVDIMEFLRIIKKRGKHIIAFVSIVVIITSIRSYSMPKSYRSEAIIMPVGRSGGISGQLGGGLASLIGLSSVGEQTASQQFMALLATRTLAEKIINKHDLTPILTGPKAKDKSTEEKVNGVAKPIKEGVIAALLGCVNFKEDAKTGVIRIIAEFTDPKLAADIANGYVEGLQEMIRDNSFTSSKRYRVFMKEQLEQNKKELLEAGKGLNEFYKSGKISSVDSMVDVSIMSNKAINDKDMKSTALPAQIDDLQKQRQEIESKLVVKGVPQQVYLQYLTIRRNLLVQINTLLAQQYEMAKIEEAKDEPSFQVIDSARIPEKKFKPNRKKMVITAFISSLFIGIFAAFLMSYLEKMKLLMKS